MTSLLKPKNIRRIIVALALLAPIGYLFGTQIATLAGAHGEEVLAETTTVTPSYDDLMQVDNFSYGAFDWENEHGYRFGFSLGLVKYNVSSLSTSFYFGRFGVQYISSNSNSIDYGLGFSGFDSDEMYVSFILDTDIYLEDHVSIEPYSPFYSCFYFVPTGVDGFRDVYVFVYESSSNTFYTSTASWVDDDDVDYYTPFSSLYEIDSYVLDDRSDWYVYFDDGAHLPAGVEWNDDLRSYFVPTVKPIETTSYRNTLFGNMFGKSNFLTDWGADALSDDRRGFAPVGQLFSYVDDNVLHLADTNIGKMAYGYMYYVVHVLLLDLVAMAFVFIVSIPERILDQINGKTGGDW